MDRVIVTTPLGPVVLEHSGTRAKALGDSLALDWWRRRVEESPFGAQGHAYNPNDCDICDVIAVALTAVGSDKVKASEAATAKAAKQLRSTPKGAIS
jgi:hypothetical protein